MEEFTIFFFKAFFIYRLLIKEWLLLLYGFEIRGHGHSEIKESIQREFWKLQLKLKYSLLSKCDKERILKKTCKNGGKEENKKEMGNFTLSY